MKKARTELSPWLGCLPVLATLFVLAGGALLGVALAFGGK